MSIIEKALSKLADERPEQHTAHVPSTADVNDTLVAENGNLASPQSPPPVSATARPDSTESKAIQLDLPGLANRGLCTPNSERSQMADEYRMIKRPILANAFGANPVPKGNLVMVTSSLPGEGKSFTAINLAISVAMELDRTVLLVDADVAKPRLPEYMGFQAEHGLLDVLRHGERDLSRVIMRTNIDKLSVLPAGRTYSRATELLASEAMDALITDLANRYPDRLVLFDSPPLLVTTESSVLASHMGQLIMVVEADKTPKSALRESLARIEHTCDVVGIVINKSDSPQTGGYYGYYGYSQAK